MKSLCLILVSLLSGTLIASELRPNVVLILADDLGWGDPQCYSLESKIPTPSMDRLAAEGIRFTDAHTPSSVCTPTRYSLLTGRYAWRTRLKSGVLDGFDPPLFEPGEDTLASLLKRTGYATHVIGKWHLGMTWATHDGAHGGTMPDRVTVGVKGFRAGTEVDFARAVEGGPTKFGFDTFSGISASLDMSPYVWMRDDRIVEIPGIETPENIDGLFMNQVAGLTTKDFALESVLPEIARETVEIIRVAAETEKPSPFFCYVPLTSPHLPVVPTEAVAGASGVGAYGDFVVETDRALGRILQALDETGAAENTIVIFTSDNGGLFHDWTWPADDDGGRIQKTRRGQETARFGHRSNADWRGKKADIYEGGHRVPFLVRWPERVSGGSVSESLVELTDVFATIAEIVGEKGLGQAGMDSFSFLSILDGVENGVTRPFAVHHSLRGMFALREGDWKWIAGRGSGGFSHPREIAESEPPGQLYHLGEDSRETRNRYSENREKAERMDEMLEAIKEASATEVAAELVR
ncbi:MAG: arylsulfatase [Verrucomicrobiota bacterium]